MGHDHEPGCGCTHDHAGDCEHRTHEPQRPDEVTCGNEHDHDHKGHRDHNCGDDCDCGHEGHRGHSYDHEHEHEGHPGNNHSHDHKHEHAGCGGFVEIALHDAAVVASYRFSLRPMVSESEIEQQVVSFITSIGSAVEERGGMIGHIKAFAKSWTGDFRVSLTDEVPAVERYANEAAVAEGGFTAGISAPSDESSPEAVADTLVEGVAIVFGVDEVWMEALLKQRILYSQSG